MHSKKEQALQESNAIFVLKTFSDLEILRLFCCISRTVWRLN